MPKYQIICDSNYTGLFGINDDYKVWSPSAFSNLSLYRWEADKPDHNYVDTVRQLMSQKKTCILHSVSPIKAVFFDMDATVIGQETIDEIAKVAGSSEQVAAITNKAMSGTLDFREALAKRVETLRGLSIGALETVHDRLTINPGLREFSDICQTKGIKIFLISGGFQRFAERIAQQLSFTDFKANQLEFENGTLTGRTSGPIVDSHAKKSFLLETCSKLAIKPQECLAVGDGANDLPMLKAAGICVGYGPKPILIPHLNGAMFENHLPLIDIINFH